MKQIKNKLPNKRENSFFIIPINIKNMHWVCVIAEIINKEFKLYYFNSIQNNDDNQTK